MASTSFVPPKRRSKHTKKGKEKAEDEMPMQSRSSSESVAIVSVAMPWKRQQKF